MRTLTTVIMAGMALMLLAACGGHDMMETSMDNKTTGMEKPMDTTPMPGMDAGSEATMNDNMANDTMRTDNMTDDSMMKPASETMNHTMQ